MIRRVLAAVLCAALSAAAAAQEPVKPDAQEPQPNTTDQQKPKRVQVGAGVSYGMLIHKVQPQYPAAARASGISGSVVMQAVIGKDGSIKNIRLVQGHPMLVDAALDAVKQWKYNRIT